MSDVSHKEAIESALAEVGVALCYTEGGLKLENRRRRSKPVGEVEGVELRKQTRTPRRSRRRRSGVVNDPLKASSDHGPSTKSWLQDHSGNTSFTSLSGNTSHTSLTGNSSFASLSSFYSEDADQEKDSRHSMIAKQNRGDRASRQATRKRRDSLRGESSQKATDLLAGTSSHSRTSSWSKMKPSRRSSIRSKSAYTANEEQSSQEFGLDGHFNGSPRTSVRKEQSTESSRDSSRLDGRPRRPSRTTSVSHHESRREQRKSLTALGDGEMRQQRRLSMGMSSEEKSRKVPRQSFSGRDGQRCPSKRNTREVDQGSVRSRRRESSSSRHARSSSTDPNLKLSKSRGVDRSSQRLTRTSTDTDASHRLDRSTSESLGLMRSKTSTDLPHRTKSESLGLKRASTNTDASHRSDRKKPGSFRSMRTVTSSSLHAKTGSSDPDLQPSRSGSLERSRRPRRASRSHSVRTRSQSSGSLRSGLTDSNSSRRARSGSTRPHLQASRSGSLERPRTTGDSRMDRQVSRHSRRSRSARVDRVSRADRIASATRKEWTLSGYGNSSSTSLLRRSTTSQVKGQNRALRRRSLTNGSATEAVRSMLSSMEYARSAKNEQSGEIEALQKTTAEDEAGAEVPENYPALGILAASVPQAA